MLTKPLQVVEGYGKLAAQELGVIKADGTAVSRFAKCVTCPLFAANFCTLCNCYMPAKVLVTKAFCPKGLWQ